MNHSNRHSRRGFTLFELLTVLAVMSVVSTIGFTIFFRIMDHWKITDIRNGLNASAQNAFDTIRRDTEQILSSRLSGIPLIGVRQLEEKKRYGLVQLENDRVVLPVQSPHPETGQIERFSVMYSIDREGATPALVRTLGALGENLPAGARQVIQEGVLALRIEYYDGKFWIPEWNQPGLPEALQFTMVLIDPDRPWEQITRQSSFSIHVK